MVMGMEPRDKDPCLAWKEMAVRSEPEVQRRKILGFTKGLLFEQGASLVPVLRFADGARKHFYGGFLFSAFK